VSAAPVTVDIDGRIATVPPGTLVVEAARQVGIEIPVFCYHQKLAPVGACRMCLVEIEGQARLQTACTTPVAPNMKVLAGSAKTKEGQNAVLELLLANHPLDCPVCDKGGECPLQDNTFKYGPAVSRMTDRKRHLEKAYPLTDVIVLDRERCIMCLRCTRFHQEIPGDEVLAVLERGNDSVIDNPGKTDSPFSGNTIELCPVGALTSREYRFRARPWDLSRTPSICVGCAVGCNVHVDARDADLLRVLARENPEVDDGWLCDRGRFATLPPLRGSKQRHRPLHSAVREGGALVTVEQSAALARACDVLRGGPAAVLASAALSNEAIAAIAGPLRAALPDARIGFTPDCNTAWPVTGRIADVKSSKRILLAGIDPWHELPVLALWIRRAVKGGAQLVVLDERNGLFRDTAVWLEAPRADLGAQLAELDDALRGRGEASGDMARAAAALRGEGPAVVLAGLDLAAGAEARARLEAIAVRLGARTSGLCGAPPLAANGRGVLELAPDLARTRLLTPEGRLAVSAAALLVLGAPVPQCPPGTAVVVATGGELARDDVEVVLPMRHAYEQAGTITNLEGRRQQMQAAGRAAPTLLAEHALIERLAEALARSPARAAAQGAAR
jgi:NADH-quinone oxidoreductase subunit G